MSKELIKNDNKELAKPKTKGTLAGLKHTQVADYFQRYLAPILKKTTAKHLSPEKVIQVASQAISRNPYLAECTLTSLLGCVLKASELGLSINPDLGQAYMVPFNNRKTGTREAQFILGYQGLIQLARNSGEILTVYADLIYEGDEWEIVSGLNPDITHKPNFNIERTAEKVEFAYAIVKYKDGGFNFSYLTKSDIEKYKKRSQAANSKTSPWHTDFEAMAKKTAILRLKPYLPKSEEKIQQVFESEGKVNNVNIETGEVEEADYSFEELNDVSDDITEEQERSDIDDIKKEIKGA